MNYCAYKDLTIYEADFLDKIIKRNSVDLIVASPPYNVGIEYNQYADGTSYDEYLRFSRQWLREAFKVLKDDGRMYINIPLDKIKAVIKV